MALSLKDLQMGLIIHCKRRLLKILTTLIFYHCLVIVLSIKNHFFLAYHLLVLWPLLKAASAVAGNVIIIL
jgi:hypothetical protein